MLSPVTVEVKGDLWSEECKTELELRPDEAGLFCFLTSLGPSDVSPCVPNDVLLDLSVNSCIATPEQVLLLLHSQLSSEILVLLQGLQDRGLCPLLASAVLTQWWLYICLLVHHSGLEKCFEFDCLVPACFLRGSGLSLLPDMALCVLLSSQLSVLPHVHLSMLHLSQSTSSVLICLLPLLHLLGLGLNLATRSHSTVVFLDLHPPEQLPLIQSHCFVSVVRLSLPSKCPSGFFPLYFSSQLSYCLRFFLLQ